MSPFAKSLLPSLVVALVFLNQHVFAQTQLFHGFGVSITPSTHSTNPVNATFGQSNFFSYGTPNGYLSFGWFLPARTKTFTARCQADSDKYEWFEYAKGDCSYEKCSVYITNFPNVANPKKPSFEGKYTSHFLSAGHSPTAKLALSYFDANDGLYAVGSRDLLSPVPGVPRGEAVIQQCNDAFATLEKLQAKRKLPLTFELVNPC